MDKLKIFLIYATGLILISFLVSAAPASSDKIGTLNAIIDPALQKLLDNGKDEEIPIIVIAKDKDLPDLGDIKVRYRYHLINGLAGDAKPSAVKKLVTNNAVQGVFLDGVTHVEVPAANEPGSETVCPASKINAEELWSRGIDGKGVTVAILDSGIDKNHPDLAGKVIGEKNFVEDEATSDDLLGHGTLVSGIVAGSGAASSGKYKGVAPGVSLLNVKVINKAGDGKLSDIIAGIEWALDNHADILSLSLGGMNLGETNPPITMAADNAADAGAVVCVAAGNRNNTQSQSLTGTSTLGQPQAKGKQIDLGMFDVSQSNGANREVLLLLLLVPLAPGLIDSPGDGVKVITMGASDCNDRIASFSGSGPTRDGRTKPSVVAPGVNVVSTVPPDLDNLDYLDIYYAKQSGTSLSTPVAAGMAALLLQADPNLTPAGVKAAMTLGAKKLNNSQGEQYEEYYQGAGRLDANKSFELLNVGLAGVIPDAWNAGRWAYLGAGKGLYVGLDTGADRPLKKIYALAPQDDEISNQFVFFTNTERNNISTTVKGLLSDWMSLQPLPRSIPANGQKIFGATIAVPNGTQPGKYSSTIEISEGNKIISSIPVTVLVAEPINIKRGVAAKVDRLQSSKWQYYYLDVPLGTSYLRAGLDWRQNANLDLFLLAPTSEYYAAEKKALRDDIDISYPPSGRWLVAVHARNMTIPVNYTLSFEQSLVETSPKRWNAGAIAPGSKAKVQFEVENKGPTLNNISYVSSVENVSKLAFTGSIGSKDLVEKFFEVPEGTSKLSVNMSAENGGDDIAFLLLDPGDKRVYATVGSENLGSPDVIGPEPGKWRIWIYGNNVPEGHNESFNAEVTRYLPGKWTWISTKGPSAIESESSATVEANLDIPVNATSRSIDGNIEIRSDNQSFLIPVSLIVAGTSLRGLNYSRVEDKDKDGYYDKLSLGFAVNVTVPGNYTVEGALVDCMGNRLDWLKGSASLQKSGNITIDVDGKEIWKTGKCGPLKIQNLFLYNNRGDLIELYNKSIAIDRKPEEFQHPSAYFIGNFSNETTNGKIGIGVGIRVIKAGNYDLSGRIEDDRGEDLGKDTVTSKLEPGNRIITLEFNPAKFIMISRTSQMHLLDLTLKLDGVEIERIGEAWSSPEIDPGYFRGGHNTVRTDKGKVVIP
jgi:subtilisin family serine protease